MTGEEFGKKVKDGLEKFVKSSKDVFGKAGEAVQNLSDKSVVRMQNSENWSPTASKKILMPLLILQAERFRRFFRR